MKTIKTKLFLSFLGLMISFIICGLIFNYLFLERYFIFRTKDVFIQTGRQIEEKYKSDRDGFDELVTLAQQTDGIYTFIFDKDFNITYSSQPLRASVRAKRLSSEIEQLMNKNSSDLAKTYIFTTIKAPNSQQREIVYISRCGDNEFLVLYKPMKSIADSVSISNQFYIFAGLIILFFGIIFIYIYSKKISRPVTEMSSVATAIANLEFDKRVKYNSNDEMGILADSINIMAQKLNYSMTELKDDVERRKQLVLNMSHELKTPIGIIKGYSEALKYNVATDKEQMEKYCGIISSECDRMDKMVKEMLNLSALESGVFELKKSKFNINSLIWETHKHFESIFREKGITFEINCPETLTAEADYELIRRVLDNYITNAIDYTSGEKTIKITAQRSKDGVVISVFNTGKNIPEEKIQNIWDVFYKADKSRSRSYGGHGLGLSIVRIIANLHNGSVGVRNTNDGVLFYIELP